MGMLPDILCLNLDVVFAGTSAGEHSARRGHYYSRPTNWFYRELHASGLTDRLLRPDEDHLLPHYGIGLTDLTKQAVSSDDRSLTESDWDRGRLEEAVAACRPRCVCFNGKGAFEAWAEAPLTAWGLQASASFGDVPVFVVPSTSGRVLARARFGGRTRAEWFAALHGWLAADRSATGAMGPADGNQHITCARQDDLATIITADIVARFESDRKAPYLDGDGHLVYGGRSGVHLVVYRRHDNPTAWMVPLSALRAAVSQSCAVGRPLRAKECNAICNRRGTPLSILLHLVPTDCYRASPRPS